MPSIFMSYRRSDSISESGRIHDHLEREFGGQNVFKDVDDIQPGFDFRKVLDDEVAKCDVLLAIIGADWATATDAEGQLRLHNPNDFVRLEVESGLKRGNDVLVIPVLIKNATMPTRDQLPESLHELTYRNAVIIRNDPDFNRDMRRLIDYIRRYAKTKQKPRMSRNTMIGSAGVVLLIAVIGLFIISNIIAPSPSITITPSPTETIETATQASQSANPDALEALYNQAIEESGNANYLEAINLFTEAIDTDSTQAHFYLGRALAYMSGANNFDAAESDLKQAIEIDPTYGEAYRYLGRYQYFADVIDEVESNLLRAIELNPSDSDARFWLAEYYANFGDYGSALEQYERMLDNKDTLDIDRLYEVWIQAGEAQNALGDVDEALASYQEAISLEPNYAKAYADIGNIYVYQEEYERALEYLDIAVDKVSDDSDIYYNRGLAQFRLENYTEAHDDFSRALQLTPTYIMAYVGRGQVNTEIGDYVSAIADLNQAIIRDDSYGEAYYLRGLAQYESENYESAIEDFTTALDLDSFTNEAYAYRGLSHEQLGDTDSARDDLQTALDYSLDDDELEYAVLIELGWLDADEENYDRALTFFTQAIALMPDNYLAYEGQMDVFSQLADSAETDSEATNYWISALDSLTRGIDVIGDSPQLIYQRGNVYAQLGWLTDDDEQLQLAFTDFETAVALDDTLTLAYVGLAELALNVDDYTPDDALSYAETAYQLDETDSYVIGTLASVYEAMGDTDEAIRYYQLAVENSDNEADREFNQGELDRLMG